jgi:perosamine synthetase
MIPVQRPFLGQEELRLVSDVFDSRWLGMGSVTKAFEDRLASLLGVRHVVAVNTGTSALHLALHALDLEPGDEVIVPSLTFVATAQAILQAGATPVFCEVLPETLNMDLGDAFNRVTPRTKAFLPVHYGGLPCEMDGLLLFAREHGIRIVEDAAHAFGSSYKGRSVGGLGDLTCFSFDPIKNITCGEGGAVTTNDDALARRLVPPRILGIDNDTWSRYRNERNWFYQVVEPGFRYHLSNVNAAIGLAQLDRFDAFRARKRAIVRQYDEVFAPLGGLTLIRHDLDEEFPFFYIVRVQDRRRDALMSHLKERGIGSGVHYIPNHIQPLFASHAMPLPVTEQVFEEILTLPLYFEMTDADVQQVTAAVLGFFSGAAA